MMSPTLRALSVKYAKRLVHDPMFSAKVKVIYRTLRQFDPERDPYQVKATAYMLACVLEELNDAS